MEERHITFCPYLGLGTNLECAGWSLRPLSRTQANWADQEFEEAARSFLKKFSDANGKSVDDPILIYRTASGIDGSQPSKEELSAIQLALDFVILDINPPYDEATKAYDVSKIATTDNTVIQVWTVGEIGDPVTTDRGFLLRVRNFIPDSQSPDFEIRAPLETPTANLKRPDAELFEACYRLFTEGYEGGKQKEAFRIQTAIRWLSKAWRNSPSLGWEDRIVMLKTAYEALTDKSQKWDSAKKLRSIFEQLKKSESCPSQYRGLLWSPVEKEDWPHTYRDKCGEDQEAMVTDLQCWFLAFSDARNAIIHDGDVPDLRYAQLDSAYAGPFFWIGERVLREAIKAKLHQLGFRDLWRDGMGRATKRFTDIAKTLDG